MHGGEIDIPLVQPSSGTLELQFRAHRAIAAGAKSLSVAVAPVARRHAAGRPPWPSLSADNVELIPNKQAIEGLVQQRIAPADEAAGAAARPVVLSRHAWARPSFAADFRVHGQRITVDVASRVMLSQHTAEVEQTTIVRDRL